MELHQLLPDFRTESFKWIESMEGSLLHLEDTPSCYAAINNLFGTIHTLKESAGLFGLNEIVVLVGAMENVLVRVCEGEVPSNEHLVTLLLSCCDHMRTLIGQTSSDWIGRPPLEIATAENALLGQLEGYQGLLK
jgi:two-component system chemotaxis sensor kinase CheA